MERYNSYGQRAYLNIWRLDTPTEPDYAYYAQQLKDSDYAGGSIVVDDESDEESDSNQLASGDGNFTDGTINETVNNTTSSSSSGYASTLPTLLSPFQPLHPTKHGPSPH
jgi:hypothetical protein